MEETMKYEVWHAKEPTFGFGDQPKFPEEYEMVAVVDCKDEEDVFEKTNHITHDWTQNPEVIRRAKKSLRSTSVGDVLVDEDGNRLYCDHVGWKDMGKVLCQ
jgi:hypothetical protein